MRALAPLLSFVLLAALAWSGAPAAASQRTVRIARGWVEAPPSGVFETIGSATVENGTMYDIYIVGAASPMADAVELLQAAPDGKAAPVAEVPVPAFDRLEMSRDGVHLKFTGLKSSLVPGEIVPIIIATDTGERLEAALTVK